MATINKEVRISVQPRITCPHCWATFAPEEVQWISAHPELTGDPMLTSDAQQRFLPSRFNVAGNALDIRGAVCHELACPHCHLVIPRSLLELPPVFISIAGTPACGKSYFLAAMTWMLRHTLPRDFLLAYADADPQFNTILTDYEAQQFINPKRDEIIQLRKTEVIGDSYDQVQQGGVTVNYPRPFLFSVRPTQQHPAVQKSKRVSKVLCLYDNAGESFLPGSDGVQTPVTRHLAKSHAVMFCFDPTQDPRFRKACAGMTNDDQVVDPQAQVTRRQEIVLDEIINRIRQHTGLTQTERRQQPLIVAVTKCDVWWPLLRIDSVPAPWKERRHSGGLHCLDLALVQKVSQVVRALLMKITPGFVTAAEEFSEQTWFIPVSATGGSREIREQGGAKIKGFRPGNIKPMWCEVPMLVALSQVAGSLIPVCPRTKRRAKVKEG